MHIFFAGKDKNVEIANFIPLNLRKRKKQFSFPIVRTWSTSNLRISSTRCITRTTIHVWKREPIIPTRGQIKVNQLAGSELQQPGRKWSLLIGPITNDKFRCGRSFVSTIGYSSVFNPIMPTGPATIPSLTAHVCICLYFRFPSASLCAYECVRVLPSAAFARSNSPPTVYILTYNSPLYTVFQF